MDTHEAFDALVEARTRDPRGADEIYSSAITTPSEPPSRRGWGIGVAAAVVLLVIGVAALAGTGRGDPQQVEVADGADDGSAEVPGAMPVPEVLGVVNSPPGFELVSAVETGISSAWAGPVGELTVFQQLSSDERRAERVLAIAVTQDDEQTVLDEVSPGPDDQPTVEPIGGLEVTFASVVAGGHTISTYGAFDLARWSGPEGATFTVASRGLDDSEVRGVVEDLIGGDSPADLAATSPTVAELDRVAADPVRVPRAPGFSSARQVFESPGGDQLIVGTELGDWPAAADLLWWAADSVLSDDGQLELADGLIYQPLPGGAATAVGAASVPHTLLRDVLGGVVGMTHADWRMIAGDADQSSDHEVATTTEAPHSN